MENKMNADEKTINFGFVFPGQGSQKVGMSKELWESFDICSKTFEEADDTLGFSLSRLCFEGPEDKLMLTEYTQPALLTASIAAYRALDIVPAAAAGHSLGEYSALTAAGVISFSDALKIVRLRGRYMQEAVNPGAGAMAALLGAEQDEVEKRLLDYNSHNQGSCVELANINSPKQLVISGYHDDVFAMADEIKALRTVMLPVSAPFHCSLMKPAEEKLAAQIEKIPFSDPLFPVFSNVDAQPVTTAEQARKNLILQVTRPVKWKDLIEKMIREFNINKLLEVGPGNVLSGLQRQIDRSVPIKAFSMPDQLTGIRHFLETWS